MKKQNIFSSFASEPFSLHKTLLVAPIDLFFTTKIIDVRNLSIIWNHLSTNPVHLQGKSCRVENERKIKSRPSGFFLSFKLLYKSTWPSKCFSTNAWHWCLLQCTGTPLIGRFLGPRKNRLHRNPSYQRSFYGMNL